MQAYPGDQSILILDNCSIHKSRELQDAVTARGTYAFASLPFLILSGVLLVYIPPYSPECWPHDEVSKRPILTEHIMAFSKSESLSTLASQDETSPNTHSQT